MRPGHDVGCRVSLLLLCLLVPLAGAGAPLGTGFEYRGKINASGNPANGLYDFTFGLWDAPSGGSPVGSLENFPAVAVTNGLFTVTLDFGTNAFRGEARWVEIGVRSNGAGAFTTLAPRQPAPLSPCALYALKAGNTGPWDLQAGSVDAGGGQIFSNLLMFAVDGEWKVAFMPDGGIHTAGLDVNAGGDLEANGDGSIHGHLQLGGNLDAGGRITAGDISATNNLSAGGMLVANGGLSTPNGLMVGNGADITGWCSLRGHTQVQDQLDVSGKLNAAGVLDLSSSFNCGGDANFVKSVVVGGDLSVHGSKGFVQAYPSDPTREIVYVCLEGPENGVYTRGTAELVHGVASVALPDHFALVASETGLTAQVTARGAWLQLYVDEVDPRHILVRDADGRDGRFDYLVQGVRRGFENHAVIRKVQAPGGAP